MKRVKRIKMPAAIFQEARVKTIAAKPAATINGNPSRAMGKFSLRIEILENRLKAEDRRLIENKHCTLRSSAFSPMT
jgi:hypothetical protein